MMSVGKLENLKMQILERKNDLTNEEWKEFINWLIDEFDFNIYE